MSDTPFRDDTRILTKSVRPRELHDQLVAPGRTLQKADRLQEDLQLTIQYYRAKAESVQALLYEEVLRLERFTQALMDRHQWYACKHCDSRDALWHFHREEVEVFECFNCGHKVIVQPCEGQTEDDIWAEYLKG